MRPQPRVPDTLTIIADRLAEHARGVDAHSRNHVLMPAVMLLRQIAEEFDEFVARRFQEIAEGLDLFEQCRGQAPENVRARIDLLLARRDALAGMRRADELEALADEVDYLLIDLQAWLESGDEAPDLRTKLRELQHQRALRWLPPSIVTGGGRRIKKEKKS
ncbi:MAG: hypothetical protein QM769_07300 [Pseudoxanthomonas sp.]